MVALKGIDHEEEWLRVLIQWDPPTPIMTKKYDSNDDLKSIQYPTKKDDLKANKLTEIPRPYTHKEKLFLRRYMYNPTRGFFDVNDIKKRLSKETRSKIISKMSRMVGTVNKKEGMLIRKGWVRRYEPVEALRIKNGRYFYRLNSTPKAFKEIILFFYDRGLLDEIMRSRYVNISLWKDEIYHILVDFHVSLLGGYIKKEQITNSIEDKITLIYDWFGVNLKPTVGEFGELNYCLRYLFVEYLKDEGRFKERMQMIKDKLEERFGKRAHKVYLMLIISHAIISSDFSKTSKQLDIVDNLTQMLKTVEV